MNIQGCVPRFIKEHGSLILTILGAVGLVATVIETAKQAPKAEKAMKKSLDEARDETVEALLYSDDLPEGCEDSPDGYLAWANENVYLSLSEKIKAAGPYYIPVILLGLGTLGCMAGAQILNMKQQAALLGAYALVQKEFSEYRKEIRDEYGAEADRKALVESQKKVRMLEANVRRLEAIKGVQTFGITTLPGVIFRSDMANIERAFLHFNRNLILRGWADLPELYSFLGLPENLWKFAKKAPDEDFGWNAYLNEVEYGCTFLDYRMETVHGADGTEIQMIDFDIPPYRVAGPEWDTESPGEFYEGYDPGEARRMLRKGIDEIPVLIDSLDHFVGAPRIA